MKRAVQGWSAPAPAQTRWLPALHPSLYLEPRALGNKLLCPQGRVLRAKGGSPTENPQVEWDSWAMVGNPLIGGTMKWNTPSYGQIVHHLLHE